MRPGWSQGTAVLVGVAVGTAVAVPVGVGERVRIGVVVGLEDGRAALVGAGWGVAAGRTAVLAGVITAVTVGLVAACHTPHTPSSSSAPTSTSIMIFKPDIEKSLPGEFAGRFGQQTLIIAAPQIGGASHSF